MPPEKIEPVATTIDPLPLVVVDSPGAELPQYPSEALFGGHRELLILHHNETYRLRVTRTNKLILTK